MSRIEEYVQAATRDNTRRSYASAIEHFEVGWGGMLPATADRVAHYLADYADSLSLNTLKQRLAAIGRWHVEQGFVDPTKAILVKRTLKGIAELHPHREKQAAPLQLAQLEALDGYWKAQLELGTATPSETLRILRNRALILLGFWRAFRSDELCRLEAQHIEFDTDTGMTLHLVQSKSDRSHGGTTYRCPALSRLCPVAACRAWLNASGIKKGPLFRGVDRWGNFNKTGMHPNSIVPLLRKELAEAGIEASRYSSHSLRRGFASWANSNDWDIKSLMEYVGWKDVKSALRYVDTADPFMKRQMEAGLRKTESEDA
ncbi:site-specific integrase [Kordiimonas lacus]|uniref:Site-specific recombinase XerD n=1 Tax=Kordiimonas lacus TaxID=637679 RepID=A0A1G6WLC5_9PROT|nr:site-specific integrase [Kordiimonas lacus]SDD66589.1 Site-specific recombinase XerD [Kordiimonas lacus]